MLTIISWIVFIPAIVWNIMFFGLALVQAFSAELDLSTRNIRDALLSLAVLFVPGVYLFGWI